MANQQLWTFEHKKSGKQVQKWFTYDQKEKWLKKNKNWFQTYSTNIGDPVRLGVKRAPSDFQKYVLGRIKNSVPGAKVEKRHHITKEI